MQDCQNHSERTSDSDRQAGGYVGYGSPPLSGRFSRGVSGNPQGRPRRPPMVHAGRRRVITAEPTEMERALLEPVICLMVDPSEPVSRARAVIARLTERALEHGDVAACREVLRLFAEAEAMGAERTLLATEREASEREIAMADAESANDEAAAAPRRGLERLADEVEPDPRVEAPDDTLRALMLLDAVEIEDGNVVAVKPWVMEAALAHDPTLPPGADLSPNDLSHPWYVLRRLGVQVHDETDRSRLAAWFIDAGEARAREERGPGLGLPRGEGALLQLVRVGDGGDEVDWVGRLKLVEGGG